MSNRLLIAAARRRLEALKGQRYELRRAALVAGVDCPTPAHDASILEEEEEIADLIADDEAEDRRHEAAAAFRAEARSPEDDEHARQDEILAEYRALGHDV